MRTIILSLFFLLTIHFASGQADTIGAPFDPFAQPCCDNYGKPLKPLDESRIFYWVKKFETKTPIDINIKLIKLGSQSINLNIHYQDKIEGDTKIINLNDTLG